MGIFEGVEELRVAVLFWPRKMKVIVRWGRDMSNRNPKIFEIFASFDLEYLSRSD